MSMENLIFQLSLTTILLGTVAASGLNSTCVTQCGSDCCSDTEKCSYHSLHGEICQQKGKMIYCADGLSYCIEPASCCGVMSCCPSDTVCCGLNSCCAKEAVCCGMSTCCPKGSACCGFSTCCSSGSRCVNGYCHAPWSSSMRWYYLVAVLIPVLIILLYLAKRRQLRLAQQRGQIIRFGSTASERQASEQAMPPTNSGYDPAPTLFEPPPYSEIANIPPEYMVSPEEKPPAYSELYSATFPDSNTDQTEVAPGNLTNTVESNDLNVDNGNGNQNVEHTANQGLQT